ncbi:hypothetical protein [Blastococcus goldschmidtiae]|uniref:Secreted protein n=1 Tax=Blastococcus goldschmidtiae TaxID=3075546 RepID=A0ABU2K660_9ACTN|nr:hypothetical protein [Blastococcus sp. DSM 46792]MDT0275677.1 hypothetical protein [Blastococcus sp. DSM 46792]
MSTAVATVLAVQQDLPEDIGKSGPLGLLLIVVLLIAVALLVRSMSGHLKKLPRSFDSDEAAPEVPDSPAELVDRAPGAEVLDSLRRQPLAIEPPRDDDGRPAGPTAQG